MSDKHENEEFDARFAREIDFSKARPNPYADRARLARRPGPASADRRGQPVPDDRAEVNAIKRTRNRRRAKPKA